MYIYANPNPKRKTVGDCVVRGISIITDQSWSIVYKDLCDLGFKLYDMPSSNAVWSEYLFGKGFERIAIPDTCPMCYTIKEFCKDHPIGDYLLGTGSHVVAVLDGNYYDTWDSGSEVPIYYFKRRNL